MMLTRAIMRQRTCTTLIIIRTTLRKARCGASRRTIRTCRRLGRPTCRMWARRACWMTRLRLLDLLYLLLLCFSASSSLSLLFSCFGCFLRFGCPITCFAFHYYTSGLLTNPQNVNRHIITMEEFFRHNDASKAFTQELAPRNLRFAQGQLGRHGEE